MKGYGAIFQNLWIGFHRTAAEEEYAGAWAGIAGIAVIAGIGSAGTDFHSG